MTTLTGHALTTMCAVGVPMSEPHDCPDTGETEEEEKARKDTEAVRAFWAKVGRAQKR